MSRGEEPLGEGDILFLNLGVRYSGTYNTTSENHQVVYICSLLVRCVTLQQKGKKSDYEIINAKMEKSQQEIQKSSFFFRCFMDLFEKNLSEIQHSAIIYDLQHPNP